jgi:hypothetical protein
MDCVLDLVRKLRFASAVRSSPEPGGTRNLNWIQTHGTARFTRSRCGILMMDMNHRILFAVAVFVFVMSYACEWWLRRRAAAKFDFLEAWRKTSEYKRTAERVLNFKNWEVQITTRAREPLTAQSLAAMASAAFGREFSVRTGDFDPIDAAFLPSEDDGAPLVAGDGPHFYVALSPNLFSVFDLEIGEGRLITVRCSPSALNTNDLEHGYRWTGKLAAQAVAGDIVSVKLDSSDFRHLDAARAVAALRSDDPRAALGELRTL